MRNVTLTFSVDVVITEAQYNTLRADVMYDGDATHEPITAADHLRNQVLLALRDLPIGNRFRCTTDYGIEPAFNVKYVYRSVDPR